MMELASPFVRFYEAVVYDVRIGATHISVYMALLQQWNLKGGKNTFYISRSEIMSTAKINSRQTYNKCMNDLKAYGYISYEPSKNHYRKSEVQLK
ncbi:hypothetical protein [Lacibacter sp.]|uniref:hypothetical protein n=1 Tax=Lacibacter sp. TaxID=1915409 RepID=UPI002B4B71BA|nr:hypothetical protein [Lacibacter sp.]HLP37775.1 hypothetical protein [Lacibacter sp.]